MGLAEALSREDPQLVLLCELPLDSKDDCLEAERLAGRPGRGQAFHRLAEGAQDRENFSLSWKELGENAYNFQVSDAGKRRSLS